MPDAATMPDAAAMPDAATIDVGNELSDRVLVHVCASGDRPRYVRFA